MQHIKNKATVVTGATGGIGEEIVLQLAQNGWNIIMVNRDKTKSKALKDRIELAYPKVRVDSFICDLSSPKEIACTIKTIIASHPAISALINNAGVLLDKEMLSDSGNDMHFQINVLAASQLMYGLRPALKHWAQSNDKATVINVSSNAIFMSKPLAVDKLKKPDKQGIFTSYANSKMAVTVLSAHVAEEFVGDRIALFAIDPGGNRTDMTSSKAAPFFVRWFRGLLPPPSKGASYILAPLFDESFKAKSGSLISSGKVKPIPKKSHTSDRIQHLVTLVNKEIIA